ncbi:Ger(x)C family spore germination protein [Paenibacillus sanguinis]|uniref:Ger(x)C family spore germination protein n=1 Tax=Paenibacillus sanguinis TaxID=225906 RepID=UPI0003762922|nr:Ger(x)C family spore germination protein [Paenibacillus sanguinis]
MKNWNKIPLKFLCFALLLSSTGCWNYSEVDKLSTVAGIAIDKGDDDKIVLTVEIVDPIGGNDSMHTGSQLITRTGYTVFDIVRHMITESGTKLYWAHAKSLIMSEEIARSGVAKVIDWYVRDTETRSDIHVLISGEKTAKEILDSKEKVRDPLSYKIEEILTNEKNVSSSPVMELWDFVDTINTPGISSILPVIYLKDNNGKEMASINGLAVFDMDRMLGKMDYLQTKFVLLLRDELQGGVIALGGYDRFPGISLEVFSNKTKVKPVIVDGEVQLQVKTHTVTAVDEAMQTVDFYTKKGRAKIESLAAAMMEEEMLKVIKFVQQKYKQDVFGFGRIIHERMPQQWKSLEHDWDERFSQLKVAVEAKVDIKNTASSIKPILIEEDD